MSAPAMKPRLAGLALAASLAACGLGVVGTTDGADAGADPWTAGDGAAEPSDAASASEDAAVEATVPDVDAPSPPLVARLNINGPAHQGVDFPGAWEASPVPGTCGPLTYTTTRTLSNTKDAPLFAGEAFGNPLSCSVGKGLVSGRYRVVLYFAEIYFGAGCPGGGGTGSRVFDVSLEDDEVLSKFDVYAAAGGCLAASGDKAGVPVVRTFEVEVDDGTLDIEMRARTNNAKLSALELFGPL